MRILWVEVRDFRNHEETRLELPAGAATLVGPNAQGKTNLLEAVYYLLTLTSPRVGTDEPLVRQGAGSAYLRAEVETETGRVLVEVEVRSSGANRIRINGSGVRRKRDLRERVRSVMSIPEDLAIVQGDPEARRRFLDEAALSLWPRVEAASRSYQRAVRQRNRLLKEYEGVGAPADLEAWDEELVVHGAAVTGARGDAVARLGPPATETYERISGGRVVIRYRPSVEGDHLEEAFRKQLAERREDELIRRRTLVGPHRDELDLEVGPRAARRFASHGEGWAAALCLRLGLARALAVEAGEPPVVLLDDPFSGLDPDRRKRLQDALEEGKGQLVISVPEESHVPPGATVWEVSDGRVRPRR